ncbi:hypothetical protein AD998_16750 [bacterium 336/3]|nr:hypothetical protein AD998_16750 [bacterium 336/3]
MELLTIKTFDNPIDAYMYKSKLESGGVLCFLFDENMTSIYSTYSTLIGGIKLKINLKDWEKAKIVLLELGDELIKICPNCYSINIDTKIEENIWKNLIKIFSLQKTNTWKCLDCGNEFE